MGNLMKSLTFWIVFALIAGAIAGKIMGPSAASLIPLGTIFVNSIKMLVIPLVFLSLVSGAAGLGGTTSASKVGITTIIFFLVTTAVAVSVGILFAEIFKPGVGIDLSAYQHMLSDADKDKGQVAGLSAIAVGMVPSNIFQSLLDGNMLQIVFFCLFLGFGLTVISEEKRKPLVSGIDTLVEVFVWMLMKIMWVAPIGIFALIAESVGTYGFTMLESVFNLTWSYFLALAVFLVVILGGIVVLFTNVNIVDFAKYAKLPFMVAFSTASSMATMPVTLKTAEEDMKINKSITSFVIPIGTTINMNGNAIYYSMVAVFFAQYYGINLGIAEYTIIIITSTIGAIGQAGVPGPSFLVVAVLLAAGIPIEGLPILYALDRIFDMGRTAINVTGNLVASAFVDKFATSK